MTTTNSSGSTETMTPRFLNLIRMIGMIASTSMASKVHRQQITVGCDCGRPANPSGPQTAVGDAEKADEMDRDLAECEKLGYLAIWDNIGEEEDSNSDYDTEFENLSGHAASGPWLRVTPDGIALLREHFPQDEEEWDVAGG